MTTDDRYGRILDALADEAARHEADTGRSTTESRAAADRLHAMVGDRLAAMRRAELVQHGAPAIERRPIRPSLLAMTRDALIARLAELARATPTLGFAHRDLTAITDNDLRTMIEDAEAIVEPAK